MNALKGVVGRRSIGDRYSGFPRLRRLNFSNKCWLSHCTTRYRGVLLVSSRTLPTTNCQLQQQRYFTSGGIFNMADTTKWTAPVVRKTFLEYFEGKGHTIGMFFHCLEG